MFKRWILAGLILVAFVAAPKAQRDDSGSDPAVPREEAVERQARGDALASVQQKLFKLRGEYRALRC